MPIVTLFHRLGFISTSAQPLTMTLENLKAGGTIRVSVTPFTHVCESPPSDAITFTTPIQEDESPGIISL